MGGQRKTRTTARGSICPYRFNFLFFPGWGWSSLRLTTYGLPRTLMTELGSVLFFLFLFSFGLKKKTSLDKWNGWGKKRRGQQEDLSAPIGSIFLFFLGWGWSSLRLTTHDSRLTTHFDDYWVFLSLFLCLANVCAHRFRPGPAPSEGACMLLTSGRWWLGHLCSSEGCWFGSLLFWRVVVEQEPSTPVLRTHPHLIMDFPEWSIT